MDRVYNIIVFDQEVSIRTDADERRVQELAAYLRRKFEQIKTNVGQAPSATQMALAVLDVANDYFEARDRVSELESHVEKRSDKIISRIELLARAGV